ncbi:hypothetical protein J7I44_08095 [Frateuria sp. MAH-13]|uniref:Uncharacterized protein n=1 Tax=Frateuria flava TaxID=2821489 RepID=A0ABS4DMK3_9GAMM|nr:hypothetical protein [Frateuria flava]MBP1474257.1 hypothetical protein [Frateuria flava]
MNRLLRRYARRLWLPSTVMIVVVVLFLRYARELSPAGKLIAAAALLASYAWTGWAEFRHMQLMDEMRRRLEMEAMVLAFIAGTGIVLALFFLNALKLVAMPFAAAPMALFGCYVVAQLWARLRYRYWSL